MICFHRKFFLLLWFHCNIDPSVLIPPPQCHGKHSTNMKLFWTQAVIVSLWKRTHLIILSFSVLILPKSWKKLYWKSKCPALLPRLKRTRRVKTFFERSTLKKKPQVQSFKEMDLLQCQVCSKSLMLRHHHHPNFKSQAKSILWHYIEACPRAVV